MCCDKLAATQYFLKKIMCCGRKNKVADTCHSLYINMAIAINEPYCTTKEKVILICFYNMCMPFSNVFEIKNVVKIKNVKNVKTCRE